MTCACLFLARYPQRRTKTTYLVNKACNGRDLTMPEDSLQNVHTRPVLQSEMGGKESRWTRGKTTLERSKKISLKGGVVSGFEVDKDAKKDVNDEW